MTMISKIGLDVHKNSFTAAAYVLDSTNSEYTWLGKPIKLAATAAAVEKHAESIRRQLGDDVELECGYEAGCLGYTLQRQLEAKGINCVILAPSTMATTPTSKKKKTDSRDAETIAQCLAHGSYSSVYIPTADDEATRDFIRMRDDHLTALKQVKQQIGAFCLRKGKEFDGKSKWTQKHMTFLRGLSLSDRDRETLDEYLLEHDYLKDKVARLDKRIEEMAAEDQYYEAARKLQCLLGIKAHTALALIAEVGDFSRFKTASNFVSWLGLVPGECSSGDTQRRTGITKAGNTHLRKLLTEAAFAYMRGSAYQKSAVLTKRQEGCDPKIIEYADRCIHYLRRWYSRRRDSGKAYNVLKIAVVRKLAGIIWALMTNHLEARPA